MLYYQHRSRSMEEINIRKCGEWEMRCLVDVLYSQVSLYGSCTIIYTRMPPWDLDLSIVSMTCHLAFYSVSMDNWYLSLCVIFLM